MTNQSICNICGANYVYRNGRWICPACGAYKAEELSNEEVTLLYHAAQKLRLADFGEAELAYDDIVQKYPQNAEGYWGRLLARYGIKYEEDFDGKKIPTCYATTIESVMGDRDYQRALELAEPDMQVYYARQANYIERVRKEWVEKASREAPYDVFICYKDSDLANGIDRTQDSIAAQELYIHLMEQGYRVFFSRESLRDKVGEKYEPYIFNALSTAKVMLVYGTNSDYITSTWLKNEWTRYEKRIRAGEKQEGSLVTICDGFSPNELPHILATAQCFDATKRSFYGDLDKYVKKYVHGEENPTATATTAQVLSGMPDQEKLDKLMQLLDKEESKKKRKAAVTKKIVIFASIFITVAVLGALLLIPNISKPTTSVNEVLQTTYIETDPDLHPDKITDTAQPIVSDKPTEGLIYSENAGKIAITGYNGDSTAVYIPETIDGMPVSRIENKAFFFCTVLQAITLPEGLEYIGDRAFEGCNALTSLVVPNSVKSIGSRAFYDCSALQTITLSNQITSISSETFSGCASLTSLTIPTGVISIFSRAFAGCTSISSVRISSNVSMLFDAICEGWTSEQTIYIEKVNGVSTRSRLWNQNCGAKIVGNPDVV